MSVKDTQHFNSFNFNQWPNLQISRSARIDRWIDRSARSIYRAIL